MRFAIVGCGVIGGAHAKSLESLADRAELVAVADTVPERAAAFATEYGVRALNSLEEVLAQPDIDVVTLATPSGLHGDEAIATLEAGKHVIIEKPLDVSVEMARKVLAAEAKSDKVAMVVSQLRYEPAITVVREAVTSGAFGKITSAATSMAWWRSQEYYDSGDWRGTWELDGGGALMNQGIHAIDLFRWLMGDPVEVYAWADRLAHERIEVEDTAVAVVRFANGAIGTIHGTTAAYPGVSRRIQIHGDKGSAIMDDGTLAYFHAAGSPYGGSGEGNQADSVLPKENASDVAAASAALKPGSHSKQFADFLDAVAEGRPPLVTVTEGAKTLALICSIYESARTGASVKIPQL